ncbi:MAG: hypothetical protein OJI70_14480 [Zavarzinia sp.]|nr:hypothetical protein [Zavarzinia sp.]
MKRLFLLTGPIGLAVVRLAFWGSLVLLAVCAATVWSTKMATPESPDGDQLLAFVWAAGVFLVGFVFLRCLAEVVITVMEIRDKLGAIERNTMVR